MLEGIKVYRDFLTPAERADLNSRAAWFHLEDWEREDCERDVLERMRFTLRTPPSELWSITASGRTEPLAKKLERADLVAALADHLDSYAPEQLYVWRDAFGKEWHRLTQEWTLMEEVLARRKGRFEAMLLDWAKKGERAEGAANLERAMRHLANPEIQVARRAVEKACGRAVSTPRSQPGHVSGPGGANPTLTPLEGDYEAARDPGIRLLITKDRVYLKKTRPTVKAGDARIFRLERTGDEFRLTLEGHHGELSAVKGLDGRVSDNGLIVTLVRGPESAALDVFKTEYKRV